MKDHQKQALVVITHYLKQVLYPINQFSTGREASLI